MKPPAFDYVRAAGTDQVIEVLRQAGGDAKIIAGGQSLMPMLNFRLCRPTVLIDINRITGLDHIEADNDGMRVGALARHHKVETSEVIKAHFPIITAAMAHVAHIAIRNRGTIGGSLAHGDPAAELPMLCLLLDAQFKVRGLDGHRMIDATHFHMGALTTALEETDLLEEITFPYLPPGTGWGFEEVARRLGDFAIVAMGATITLAGERVSEARVAITGVGEVPARLAAAEALLVGKSEPELTLLDAIARAVMEAIEPSGDLHVSADYRQHISGALARHVVRAAWLRAKGQTQ